MFEDITELALKTTDVGRSPEMGKQKVVLNQNEPIQFDLGSGGVSLTLSGTTIETKDSIFSLRPKRPLARISPNEPPDWIDVNIRPDETEVCVRAPRAGFEVFAADEPGGVPYSRQIDDSGEPLIIKDTRTAVVLGHTRDTNWLEIKRMDGKSTVTYKVMDDFGVPEDIPAGFIESFVNKQVGGPDNNIYSTVLDGKPAIAHHFKDEKSEYTLVFGSGGRATLKEADRFGGNSREVSIFPDNDFKVFENDSPVASGREAGVIDYVNEKINGVIWRMYDLGVTNYDPVLEAKTDGRFSEVNGLLVEATDFIEKLQKVWELSGGSKPFGEVLKGVGINST